jgi:hypothetical protein
MSVDTKAAREFAAAGHLAIDYRARVYIGDLCEEVDRLRAEVALLTGGQRYKLLLAESARLRAMILEKEFIYCGNEFAECPDCARPWSDSLRHQRGCAWGAICDEARKTR